MFRSKRLDPRTIAARQVLQHDGKLDYHSEYPYRSRRPGVRFVFSFPFERAQQRETAFAIMETMMWLGAVVDVRLNDGRARIPKSQQGRPKLAHGFNCGLRVENGESPDGAKEKMGLNWCVLSSLTGLLAVIHQRLRLLLKSGWALFEPFKGVHPEVVG